MPGFLNRHRAGRLMAEAGLEALVLCQPESIRYATGAFPGVASNWRRAGAAFVLVPADPEAPLVAIVGDLQAKSFAAESGISDVRTHRIWVETGTFPETDAGPTRSPRPAQYDPAFSRALLRDAMDERGLRDAAVGIELGFVPVADFPGIQTLPVRWADCTRLVERLRAIKAPGEIDRLRRAAEYARAGLIALVPAICTGMTAGRMTDLWRDAACEEARRTGDQPPSCWAYIAVGGDGFAPGGPARAGDLIKLDVGCMIDGYSSDGGRTAVLGAPSPAAVRIHDALHRAFDAGLSLLKPGTPLADVYRVTAATMWELGYERYNRGHFGHGVGASIWSEEWPFISHGSDAVAEPGMVLAFETPWYLDGLGGFIIEDQLLVTETGVEVMAPLPRDLMRTG